MRSSRLTTLSLPWAFVGSLLLHVAMIAPVGVLFMQSSEGGTAPLLGTVDQSLIESPPPPEREADPIDLGIEEGEPSSLNWIGFEEYQKHLAMLSETEQPALGTAMQAPEIIQGAPVPIAPGGSGSAGSPNPPIQPTPAMAQVPPAASAPPAAEAPQQPVASINDPLVPKAEQGGTQRAATMPTSAPQPPMPLNPMPAAHQSPRIEQPEKADRAAANEPVSPAPPGAGALQLPEAVQKPGLLGDGSANQTVTIAPGDTQPPSPSSGATTTSPETPTPQSPSQPQPAVDPALPTPSMPVENPVPDASPPPQQDAPRAQRDAPPPDHSTTLPQPGLPAAPVLPEPVAPESPLPLADAPQRDGIPHKPGAPDSTTTPAESSPPQPPAPAAPADAAAPATSSAPPSKPAPPAQSPAQGAGMASDKESDATSIIDVPKALWQSGKPLAAKGLELKPRRPQFTMLMRVTSAPGNPICLIQFGRDGKPASARILRSTGDPQVDEVIYNSLFGWRASGAQLKTLREGQTVDIAMRLILMEEPD